MTGWRVVPGRKGLLFWKRRRAEEARDLSGAGREVYLGQKGALEPLEEIDRDSILILDTNSTVAEGVDRVEQCLRDRRTPKNIWVRTAILDPLVGEASDGR